MASEYQSTDHHLFWFRRRLGVAAGVVFVGLCVLAGRFIYMQGIKHESYLAQAESNRIDIQAAPPNRGTITDRNGVLLATNYSAYTLELNPQKITNLDTTIDEVAKFIEITPRDRRKFKRLYDEFRTSETLPLKTRLTEDEVARISANRYHMPAVDIRVRFFRQYPQGETAAHVIGYIGRINQKDKENLEDEGLTANYKGSDYLGKSGIESSYEKQLHGTTGATQVEVDAARRVVRTLSKSEPVNGQNLQLSIDIAFQKYSEKAFGNKVGAMVAMDPTNGDVLAYVSRPTFDPNLFVEGIDPQSWDELRLSPDKPMLNRPIQGAYPPGSTYKPFMALMAQEMGVRTAYDSIRDPGYFEYANSHWNDDVKHGHGIVDLVKSIAVSCDTYYYKLASELDVDKWATFMRQFGFGRKTGIDLRGENSGVLPDRAWKAKRFPKTPRVLIGDQVSMGIGQGYNTFTPLQLAYATSIFANRGVAFKPHLVKKIQDVVTGQFNLVEPTPSYTIPLKAEHIDAVKRGMVGVVTSGTARKEFRGTRYSSGGKTGTAQVYSLEGSDYNSGRVAKHLRDHAWYIAFAPVDKPTIAIAVFVENGGFGAEAAAPIARKVMDAHFNPRLLDGLIKPDAKLESKKKDAS